MNRLLIKLNGTLLILSLVVSALSIAQSPIETAIYISSSAWSPDGMQIATGDTSGMIRIWDSETFTLQSEFQAHDAAVHALAWRADGQQLASGSGDETAKIWEVPQQKLVRLFEGHGQAVTNVLWSVDNLYLYTSTTDPDYSPALRKWNIRTGDSITSEKFVAGGITLSPDGMYLIAASTIKPYRINAETLVYEGSYGFEGDREANFQAVDFVISSDGQKLAVGYLNGWVRIWDIEQKTLLAQYAAHDEHPACCVMDGSTVIAVHLTDSFVAAVTLDGTFRVWDLSEEALITDTSTIKTNFETSFSAYAGRLAVAVPSPKSENQGPDIQIIVPDPSIDRLNAIAESCDAPRLDSLDALPDFIAQVEALPEGAIPTACRADLLAVAGVLR